MQWQKAIHKAEAKGISIIVLWLKIWRILICGQTTNAFFAFFDKTRVETWVQTYEKNFIFPNLFYKEVIINGIQDNLRIKV